MKAKRGSKEIQSPDFSNVINQNKYKSFSRIMHDIKSETQISKLKIQFVVAIDYSNSNEFSGY